MKFQLLFLCCILQSIYGVNIKDYIIYPPDAASTRIVGGEDAPTGAAPYQCSLQINRRHNCGCAIISNKYILTASHCLSGKNLRELEVLVGSQDLTRGGTYYKLRSYKVHEKANMPQFANDVGVARVEGLIELNDQVQPIEYSPDEVPDGSDVILTGWGRLSSGGRVPENLQIIKLKLIQTERCRKIIGSVVHASHLCTFTKRGEGACNGDSGGPLVYENKVVGLVNFGVPCALGRPDGFAKVSYLYDWIKEHTQE